MGSVSLSTTQSVYSQNLILKELNDCTSLCHCRSLFKRCLSVVHLFLSLFYIFSLALILGRQLKK